MLKRASAFPDAVVAVMRDRINARRQHIGITKQIANRLEPGAIQVPASRRQPVAVKHLVDPGLRTLPFVSKGKPFAGMKKKLRRQAAFFQNNMLS